MPAASSNTFLAYRRDHGGALCGIGHRAATFYNAEPGAKVVCKGPSVQGGDSSSDDGNWFGVTVAIPFEFYFIA